MPDIQPFVVSNLVSAQGPAEMKKKNIPDFRRALRTWFEKNHRDLPWRRTRDPYRIWVSEVMLQQTQVKRVLGYFDHFLDRFPDIRALATADLGEVLKRWEGLGYYARARNLHRAAQTILREMDGKLPDDGRTLRQLPGIGDYIASAVLSIAFNRPCPAVDGNVKRILSRLFRIGSPISSAGATKAFRKRAQEVLDPNEPGRFNQAMMELGAVICRPREPACRDCPVEHFCRAHRSGLQDAYPVRTPRKSPPERHVVAGVVYRGDRFLITRRRPAGLLGGLWEFPGGKVEEGEKAEDALRREVHEEVGLSIEITRRLTRIRHAYSHFRIVMDVFACRYMAGEVVLRGAIDHRWIPLREIDDYPFPGANHKFLALIKEDLERYDR